MMRIQNLADGDLYYNHQGSGHRLKGVDSMRVRYLALELDGQRVAWASYIHEGESDSDEAHVFLNCCFTHPDHRGRGLFKILFERIVARHPDHPIRGLFLNKDLERFVDRYNDSLAGMLN